MSRTLYGLGAHGGVVADIQKALTAQGDDTKGADGLYGKNTALAVQAFQSKNKIPVSATVDDVTWQALMKRPIPGTDVRSLELTAAFEGHGYTLAQGNFDGAWLTWGIIGFTLKHAEVQKILLATPAELIEKAFGEHAQALLAVMRDSPRNQESWAESVTVGGGRLAEPWRTGFALLGQFPQVQDLQRQNAHTNYFLPALSTAKGLKLKSELGLALCFDIHVQNGGIKSEARADIERALAAGSPSTERGIREIVANAVANHARTEYVDDVRQRKLTIARGEGKVHGAHLIVENWGLNETPTPEL
jgi:hypothetical protein